LPLSPTINLFYINVFLNQKYLLHTLYWLLLLMELNVWYYSTLCMDHETSQYDSIIPYQVILIAYHYNIMLLLGLISWTILLLFYSYFLLYINYNYKYLHIKLVISLCLKRIVDVLVKISSLIYLLRQVQEVLE
jgi:hypothetical protein